MTGAGTAGPHAAGAPAGGVRLRPMRERDLAAVLALERELFPEDAWTEEMFRDELADAANRLYLVAEEGPEATAAIVGYAGLFVHGATADVHTIGVRSARWGRGIGGMLLTALLDEADRRGCREVFLEVRDDNDRAQRLYRRFGFRAVGVRPGYYQQAGADAIVMRRERAAAAGPLGRLAQRARRTAR